MRAHATWTDPHSGRADEADITGWRIEGAWVVLDCEASPGSMGRTRPGTMLIPATTVVRIEDRD